MEQAVTSPTGPRRDEDIALDLLKFVAASAGLGRTTTPATGFAPPSASKPEDQVRQLLDLYSKCLDAVQGKGEAR